MPKRSGARSRTTSKTASKSARMPSITMTCSGPKLSGSTLSQFELILGLNPLPPEYRKFLLKHNGGTPTPAFFEFKRGRKPTKSLWVDHFLGIDRRSLFGVHKPDLVSQLIKHRTHLPMWFLPIGYVVRDDLLLLGVLDWHETYGQIWIQCWDEVEMRAGRRMSPGDGLYQLAPSFRAFLGMLDEDPEAS